MISPLEQSNIDWHHRLERAYSAFLYHLTALDLNRATEIWEEYKAALQTHIAYEEEYITPLEPELAQQVTLVGADHTILRRLMTRIDPALETLKQSNTQRETMVEQLDGYLKMRNVLKHHDLREVQEFYPALVQKHAPEALLVLGQKMAKELEQTLLSYPGVPPRT